MIFGLMATAAIDETTSSFEIAAAFRVAQKAFSELMWVNSNGQSYGGTFTSNIKIRGCGEQAENNVGFTHL